MANIIRTFLCDEDEVLTTEAAFIGFQVLARSRGVKYRTVPYNDWRYDLPALAAAINEHTKIIYLANPNNPTGTIFTRQEFDAFYKHVPERVLIILDEAYFEYAKDNPRYPDSMHYRYDNVITLRTFSKVYGLAGVRIGYGFAHEELIRNVLKVKLPFEPSTLAQAAAIGALADKEFVHRSLELNARALAAPYERLAGNAVLRSSHRMRTSSWLCWNDDTQAIDLSERLLRQGIVIRPLARVWSAGLCSRLHRNGRPDRSLSGGFRECAAYASSPRTRDSIGALTFSSGISLLRMPGSSHSMVTSFSVTCTHPFIGAEKNPILPVNEKCIVSPSQRFC